MALTSAPSLSRRATSATSPSKVADISGVLPSGLSGALALDAAALPAAHSRAIPSPMRMISGLAGSAGGVAELLPLDVRALRDRQQHVGERRVLRRGDVLATLEIAA